MKKLLSLLAISAISLTISSNVTSCFLFPKKESLYDEVFNKINGTTSLTWENKDVASEDGKVHLEKQEEGEFPDVWTILLTDLFGLESNDVISKDEFHFITDISCPNNILEKGKQTDVSITLSKLPNSPNTKTETITRKITWTTGQATDQELVDEIFNEINNTKNIYALGINLNSDLNNALTKDAIMNNIGLTDEQKEIVTFSGNLNLNTPVSVKFDIKKNDAENSLNKDVTWYKESPTFTNKYSEYTALIDGYVYSGSRQTGLYRSEDGVTFQEVDKDTFGSKRCNVIYQTKNGDIYVGTRDNGLYKSTDGNKFVKIDESNIGTKDFVSILETDNGDIYLGTGSDSATGIYRSKDGGNSFEQIDNSLTSYEIHNLIQMSDGSIFAATDNGLYQASKDSDNFEQVSAKNIGTKDVYSFELINNELYAGTSDGLYTSSDYKSFTKVVSAALGSKNIMSIFKGSDNKIYVGTENYGLYVSTSASEFEQVTESPSDEVSHIEEFNNTLILSYDSDYTTEQTQGLYYYYLEK